MKLVHFLFLILFASMVNLNAQTQIIAHRGYWKTDDNAQNSIKSLQKAAEIKAYGSEMDVHLTVDDVLIVFHDDVLNGKRIDESTFDELSLHVLNNGEKIPTLKDYLIEGKKYPDLKLIVELKPHQTHETEDRLVEKTLALIEKLNLDDQVEYISFSQNICTQLKSLQPRALVSYLNGDLSPKQVKARKWDGIDYHYKIFQKNLSWIKEAHALGLMTNTWTVNKAEDMQWLINQHIQFISTDEPEALKELLSNQ